MDDHDADTGEHEPGGGAPHKVVLVAVDFGEASRRGLAWAVELALATPCALHTLHVVERRWRAADLDADLDAQRAEVVDACDDAGAALAALVDDAARLAVASLREHVVVGDPGAEICRLAGELGAELVVVGEHGAEAGAAGRRGPGAVAARVVRDARCPVLVARERA